MAKRSIIKKLSKEQKSLLIGEMEQYLVIVYLS
jgi:hypothetical protein